MHLSQVASSFEGSILLAYFVTLSLYKFEALGFLQVLENLSGIYDKEYEPCGHYWNFSSLGTDMSKMCTS